MAAADPPASLRQLRQWLRALPISRRGVLSRTTVADWTDIPLSTLNFFTFGAGRISPERQHRLSKLMRELNDGRMRVDILPDAGAVLTRAVPVDAPPPVRATIKAGPLGIRIDWRR